ncbi:MAG TPA: PQQ-binding-like beta-propeller repeat protein [Solirubrobacterales bacterium]|jgi:alcohol dehydrogenase (cytochrome c)|nr:PQQ-binding-like beta-propeller repeat protein [Solirubrobacterales bacterium]HMW45669.1 PQQ-binding-like beta-propeller repeat protein [Solirubrobacterales bacterium]HNA22953.1 PQQ-binding-like beta-propeller repeat protein [Solirubrobacterales bacterium]HNA44373.1 PQQ-binding-like beta-propeller repeat protein [Solirubrobacterales bacterium]HNC05265.1 PQQ-binding-like beta-propeller repeat protein [Solirubrobacterales bacterium]
MFRGEGGLRRAAAGAIVTAAALGLLAPAASAGTVRKPAGTPRELRANAGGGVAANVNMTNSRKVISTGIDSGNVADLAPAWTFPLTSGGIFGAMSSNPIVSDGVLYFSDAASNVYALDAFTGIQKWKRTFNVAGLGQNGVTLANGRLLAGVDSDVLSLDATTGKTIWRTTLNASDSAAVDMAPLAWKDLIIVSTIPFKIGTGIYKGGQKGVVFGLNAKTGRKVWSFDTTTDNLWGNPAVNSGGGLWSTPSIDDHGTMYMSVANPGPLPGTVDFPNGSSRPGRNLYTNSLVALNAATGKLKWFFQAVPHDFRDYDLQLPPILATFRVNGRKRDVVITGGKMGTVYVVDRRNGKLIWKRNVGRHNQWGDPARDLPTAAEDLPVTMYPGVAGGVETPMSVSGNSIFVPVSDLCATVVSVTTIVSCPYQTGTGAILALGGGTGRTLWKTPIPTLPDGATTVVGDVVMAPGVDGTLYSLRASDGEILASPKAITGVNAPPAVSGRTVYIGAGAGPGPAVQAWRLP